MALARPSSHQPSNSLFTMRSVMESHAPLDDFFGTVCGLAWVPICGQYTYAVKCRARDNGSFTRKSTMPQKCILHDDIPCFPCCIFCSSQYDLTTALSTCTRPIAKPKVPITRQETERNADSNNLKPRLTSHLPPDATEKADTARERAPSSSHQRCQPHANRYAEPPVPFPMNLH